jgi:hypothetical protein
VQFNNALVLVMEEADPVVTVGTWELLVPVPLSGTLCGLPEALSVTLRVALCAPACVGLKVTDTAQFAPVARLVPQALLVRLKAPWFLVRSICVIWSVAVPVFVTVTD